MKKIYGVMFLYLGLAGCGPKVTPIGPGFVYQPNDREQRLWDTSKQLASGIEGGGKIYKDQELQVYLQSVLHRVLGGNENAYLPLEPRVVILDCPVDNAFTLSQGEIFVATGMLGRIRTEAQLAMLLGHEVTHATHRHIYQERERGYATTGAYSYAAVLSAIGGSHLQDLVQGLGGVLVLNAMAGYSREKEEEADKTGLTLMAQAGYEAAEGAKMFEAMAECAEKKVNFFYNDHPKMELRIRYCKQLCERLPSALIAQAKDVGQDRYIDKTIVLIHDEVRRHVAQGKYPIAEKTLNCLAEARPRDPMTYTLFGDLYRARAAKGDRVNSKHAYDKALALDGRCAEAQKGLGYAFAHEGENGKAIEHLNAFLELSPTAVDAPYVREYVAKLSR